MADGELRGTCDECGCSCASRVCAPCDEAGAPAPCSECGSVGDCADYCRAEERDAAPPPPPPPPPPPGYLAAHPAEAAGVAGACGGL
jgi:hypothetical protein